VRFIREIISGSMDRQMNTKPALYTGAKNMHRGKMEQSNRE